MYRFVDYSRRGSPKLISITITVAECEFTFWIIVKLLQRNMFEHELIRLYKKEVKKSSSLRFLSPFLDENCIIRVGGRLKNTELPFDKKYPIILSAKCSFIRLYLKYLHKKHFHCNKGLILTLVINKFWIVGGCHNLVKRIINKCIFCTRLKLYLNVNLWIIYQALVPLYLVHLHTSVSILWATLQLNV